MRIRTDLVWKPAFPEWSGWHTNYSLLLALSCSDCMSFWKLLTRPTHHPAEPGLHTDLCTQSILCWSSQCALWVLDKRISWKYKPGIIVVGTTAALRVTFVPQINHREASPKKSLDILFAKIALTFCHFRQCNLIEDFWLLSREVVLWICLSQML